MAAISDAGVLSGEALHLHMQNRLQALPLHTGCTAAGAATCDRPLRGCLSLPPNKQLSTTTWHPLARCDSGASLNVTGAIAGKSFGHRREVFVRPEHAGGMAAHP